MNECAAGAADDDGTAPPKQRETALQHMFTLRRQGHRCCRSSTGPYVASPEDLLSGQQHQRWWQQLPMTQLVEPPQKSLWGSRPSHGRRSSPWVSCSSASSSTTLSFGIQRSVRSRQSSASCFDLIVNSEWVHLPYDYRALPWNIPGLPCAARMKCNAFGTSAGCACCDSTRQWSRDHSLLEDMGQSAYGYWLHSNLCQGTASAPIF